MQVNFHAVAHRQPAASQPKKPPIYQHTPLTINTPLDPLNLHEYKVQVARRSSFLLRSLQAFIPLQ